MCEPVTAAPNVDSSLFDSDPLEIAWGLIANAYGGDWELATPEWQAAAIRWRDEVWHPYLAENSKGQTEAAEVPGQG